MVVENLEKRKNIQKFMKAQRLERRKQRNKIELEKQLKNDQMRCSLESLKKTRQGVLARLQNRQVGNIPNKNMTRFPARNTPDPSRLTKKKNILLTKNGLQSSFPTADPGSSPYEEPIVSRQSHATHSSEHSSGQIKSKYSADSLDSSVERKVSPTDHSLTSSSQLQQEEIKDMLNRSSSESKLQNYNINEKKLNDNNTEIKREVEIDIPLYSKSCVAENWELAPLIDVLGQIDTGVVKIGRYEKSEEKNDGRQPEVNFCIGQSITTLLNDKTIYKPSPCTNDSDVGEFFSLSHYSAIPFVVEAIYRRQQVRSDIAIFSLLRHVEFPSTNRCDKI